MHVTLWWSTVFAKLVAIRRNGKNIKCQIPAVATFKLTWVSHYWIMVMEWGWIGNKRPDYMWEGNFIPCHCKICFFCLKGYTSGIAHSGTKRPAPTMVQYKCITTLKTKKCTADCQSWQEQRVLQNVLQNIGQEFKICRYEREGQDFEIGVCNLLEIGVR